MRQERYSVYGPSCTYDTLYGEGSESDEADTSLPQHSILRAAAKALVSAINVAVDELERVIPLELNT